MQIRKYLFIAANEWTNWGGSELLWSLTAERLVRRGNEIRVSVPGFARPMREVDRVRSAGGRIVYRRPPSFLSRQVRKIFPISEYNRSHVCSVGNGIDLIVISQGSTADGLVWMEAARAAGLPYVVIVQGASEILWPDDDSAEKLALNYENALRAYFVSEATVNLCRRQFGSPLRNAKVIRNPFNVSYEARSPWPANSSDELSLACVARLHVVTKGQDLLLGVLALPHWRERSVRVSLIGAGPNERGLRCMADGLKLTNVSFAGHQNDIEEVWSKHDALVLPSRMEGMPLVVVEAMLCGRPCIATNVGGTRELIRDGVNGFLAKAPTVPLIDEAMSRAWEDRRKLRQMGDAAAMDVRNWVSRDPIEDFVRELEALLVGSVNNAKV